MTLTRDELEQYLQLLEKTAAMTDYMIKKHKQAAPTPTEKSNPIVKATKRQIDLIARLVHDLDIQCPNLETLTIQEASAWIDSKLKRRKELGQ